MAADHSLDLVEVAIERVLGFRESAAAAVVLVHEKKRFLIFVGPAEGAAVQRELAGQRADRPATHDLLDYILKGFEIVVTKVVVSSIVNNVFCATITLDQVVQDGGPKNEVRIDARASDSIVVALKGKVPLFVTRRVLDAVEDATEHLAMLEAKTGLETAEPDDKPPFEFDPGEEDDPEDQDSEDKDD